MHGLSFTAVAQAIATHLPPATGDTGEEAAHLRQSAMHATPRPEFATAPQRDYTAILAAAIAAAEPQDMAAIAQALAPVSDALPWHYHYAARPGEADLGDRIAFAEVIGPDGPLDAPDCRIGFTLMARDTFYPLHAHPAVELYLVISGHARWTTPAAERIVPPGGFVLHRSNEPHAMRTFETPLLALYGWRGSIDQPAVYL